MEHLQHLNNVKLVMIGDPEDKIKQKIQNLNLNNVEAVGFKSNVDDFYKNSSILMVTSLFEGYGLMMAEAISHGLPVVAFDMPYLAIM
jgi:glycosyltransferase involved in cell wall biosynthesis